jgi:hypothetical protein
VKAILVLLASGALIALVNIGLELHVIALQATIANCLDLAERGVTCAAAGGDKPKPTNRGAT